MGEWEQSAKRWPYKAQSAGGVKAQSAGLRRKVGSKRRALALEGRWGESAERWSLRGTGGMGKAQSAGLRRRVGSKRRALASEGRWGQSAERWPCSSWLLLTPPGSSWLLLAPPGSSWPLLAPACPSWLLPAFFSSPWPQIILNYCSSTPFSQSRLARIFSTIGRN
jgi:hypothetical protein